MLTTLNVAIRLCVAASFSMVSPKHAEVSFGLGAKAFAEFTMLKFKTINLHTFFRFSNCGLAIHPIGRFHEIGH